MGGLCPPTGLAFPNLPLMTRPLNTDIKIKDPNWLAGFVSAEGNFLINIMLSGTKVGKQVSLVFSIAQHSRDAALLQSISTYLSCGYYSPRYTRDEGNFLVTKYSDIHEKIILFFYFVSYTWNKSFKFFRLL